MTAFGLFSSLFPSSVLLHEGGCDGSDPRPSLVLRPSMVVSLELAGGLLYGDRGGTMFGNLCAYRCAVSDISHSR